MRGGRNLKNNVCFCLLYLQQKRLVCIHRQVIARNPRDEVDILMHYNNDHCEGKAHHFC